VSFGDGERTIVVGLKKERADPKEIEGKQALFVVNLAPRKMKGVVSEGMVFDIGYADGLVPVLAVPEATCAKRVARGIGGGECRRRALVTAANPPFPKDLRSRCRLWPVRGDAFEVPDAADLPVSSRASWWNLTVGAGSPVFRLLRPFASRLRPFRAGAKRSHARGREASQPPCETFSLGLKWRSIRRSSGAGGLNGP
jgi:hypothetical protein